jgi:hypothetical protein
MGARRFMWWGVRACVKVQQQLCVAGEVERFMSRVADGSAYQGAGLWAVRGFSDFGAQGATPATDAARVAALIRCCFATQYALSDVADGGGADGTRADGASALGRAGFGGEPALSSSEAVALALSRPDDFVLKPQREGGGNNYYGAALAAKLQGGGALADLVLMERIRPPLQPAVLVRRGRPVAGPTLSELGVFGAFLAVQTGGGSGLGGLTTVLVNEYAGHILRTKLEGVDEGGVATGFSVLSSPLLV